MDQFDHFLAKANNLGLIGYPGLKSGVIDRGVQFAVFLIITILFSGCEKTIFDYRHKYIGEWDFSVSEKWQTLDTTLNYNKQYNYHGEVSYGGNDDELEVQFNSRDSVIMVIDRDGNLNKKEDLTWGGDSRSGSGSFGDKNSISLYLRTTRTMLGGLGEWTINGTRD
jgi:hypothetical protein